MAVKEKQKSRLHITNAQNDARYVDRGTVLVLHLDKNSDADIAKMNRRKNDHPFTYSETLIVSIAIIRTVCGLPYRMCEGLAQEVLGRENAPDFTTLQRRINKIDTTLVNKHSGMARGKTTTVRIIPDGTGMTPSVLYRERKVREQNIKLFTNMIMPMAKNQLKWNFEPHPTLGCMN